MNTGKEPTFEDGKYLVFPNGLRVSVEEDINLKEVYVGKFPEGVNNFGGCLDLDEIEIYELPDNINVDTYLYICKTKIKELPSGMVIGGSLNITGTEICELPEDMNVCDLFMDMSSFLEKRPSLSSLETCKKYFASSFYRDEDSEALDLAIASEKELSEELINRVVMASIIDGISNVESAIPRMKKYESELKEKFLKLHEAVRGDEVSNAIPKAPTKRF